MINELFLDFLKQNKLILSLFILLTLLTFPAETIVIPQLYGKLFTSKPSKVFKIILFIIGAWLIIQFFYVLKNLVEKKIMPSYLEYIRTLLYVQVIKKYEYEYKDIVSSNFVNKLMNISWDARILFGYFCNSILPLVLSLIVVGSYFFYQDWKIGIFFILILLASYIILKNLTKKIILNGINIQNQYLKMMDKMVDSYDNLMNIYLNNEKENEFQKMEKIQSEYKKEMMKTHSYICNFTTITVLIVLVLFFGVTSISFYNFKKGKNTFINFMSIVLVVIYLMGFLINLSISFPFEISRIGYLKASSDFVSDIFNLSNKKYLKNISIDGDIEFKEITYAYDKHPICKALSLKIKNKSRVGIVGRSGSGKTTLMKLLLGLSRPQKGQIFINGVLVENINPVELRKQVIYINQRTAMFNGSIKDNLKYGNDLSDQELTAIIKKYGFSEVLGNLNKKVGYQGKSMSGGMQKIIINLRGILKKGKIIIFDEPLAGLDGKNRERMIRMIQEMTQGKTLIIITHDREILKIVDKIIDLNQL